MGKVLVYGCSFRTDCKSALAGLNETVSGKLAYNITNDISFAGNDNTFVFKNTADINIKSENTIRFLPGFKIEEGAKLSARISANQNKSSLANNTHQQINYLTLSPYKGKINNYARLTAYDGYINTNIGIYPNPTKGIFTVEIENNNNTELIIRLYNNIGILLYKEKMGTKNKFSIDLSTFTNGLYQIEIEQGDFSTFKKIIKI